MVVLPNRRRFDPACRVGGDVVPSMRSGPSLLGPADEWSTFVAANVACPILDGPSFSGFCAEEWIFPVAQPPGSAPVLNVRFC